MLSEAQSEAYRSGRRSCLLASAILGLAVVSAVVETAPVAVALQLSDEIVRIEGAVYGEAGRSITNARVRLESEEGDQIWESGLDEQGRYAFTGLRRAVYQLVVTAEGYETHQETIDLTRTPTHMMIDVTLTALSKGAAGPPPSLTDAQAPRNARKEYDRGMKALAANRIPDAKAHFAKAVKEYPCYARAQTAEALSLISDRDLKGAEGALRKAIECDAGFSSAYLKLGELYNAELRFKDSQQVLENGLRLDPGSWKFHYHLAAAYYGLTAYPKAEEEYLRSESLTPPAPPDVHVKLADVYSKERRFGRAYAEMKAYLEADPNGQFAGKVKEVMSQMRAAAAAARAGAPAQPQGASKQ
jgi:tetratricopeptide (TPR) repeat protein